MHHIDLGQFNSVPSCRCGPRCLIWVHFRCHCSFPGLMSIWLTAMLVHGDAAKLAWEPFASLPR